MNPIQQAQAELDVTYAVIEVFYRQHSFMRKGGTGWCAAHYGVSQERWDWAHAEAKRLDDRVSALRREIARLKRISGARRKTTIHAHR